MHVSTSAIMNKVLRPATIRRGCHATSFPFCHVRTYTVRTTSCTKGAQSKGPHLQLSRQESCVRGWPTMQSYHRAFSSTPVWSKAGYSERAPDAGLEVSVCGEGKQLSLTWEDGSTSSYNSSWLRHNCHNPISMQEGSGQRLFDPADLPVLLTLVKAEIQGNNVHMYWKEEEDYEGIVPLNFLKDNDYSMAERQRRRLLRAPLVSEGSDIQEVHYDELMSSPQGVLKWLLQLNEFGMSLIRGVPTVDGTVRKVAELIGPIQPTIYGETFDVVSTPNPINVAYSTTALPFHMDLIYYESAPGLQFLHCMRNDACVEGGESIFLDIFPIAEQMRQEYPEDFYTLTRVPATFQKIHYERERPVDFQYQKPHIVLNEKQDVTMVNWAPAFEGPLFVDEEDVEPYYRAYHRFATMLKNSPRKKTFRLEPGDLASFNNRRVLHARHAFQLNGGQRHLQGTYLQIDEFKSQVQVYSKLYGDGRLARRVGNQCAM